MFHKKKEKIKKKKERRDKETVFVLHVYVNPLLNEMMNERFRVIGEFSSHGTWKKS